MANKRQIRRKNVQVVEEPKDEIYSYEVFDIRYISKTFMTLRATEYSTYCWFQLFPLQPFCSGRENFKSETDFLFPNERRHHLVLSSEIEWSLHPVNFQACSTCH